MTLMQIGFLNGHTKIIMLTRQIKNITFYGIFYCNLLNL